MTSEEDSIAQASIARRERLKALRAAKEFSSMPDEDQTHNESNAEDPVDDQREQKVDVEEESMGQAAAKRSDGDNVDDSEKIEEYIGLKFRNYLPHDKQLQEGKLAPVALPTFEDPIATTPPSSDKVEDPFVNIAPKKPNWDLRKVVQKKLDKLERRTEKAIYQLTLEKQKELEAMEAENGATEDVILD